MKRRRTPIAAREPVLYLSTYLKQYQRDYFRCLTAVREKGDWEGWLKVLSDRSVRLCHQCRRHGGSHSPHS